MKPSPLSTLATVEPPPCVLPIDILIFSFPTTEHPSQHFIKTTYYQDTVALPKATASTVCPSPSQLLRAISHKGPKTRIAKQHPSLDQRSEKKKTCTLTRSRTQKRIPETALSATQKPPKKVKGHTPKPDVIGKHSK